MNGIELLQLIKEGKIENDTFINVYYADDDLGKTLICELRYINNQIYWEEGTFKVSYLYNDNYKFQIVEKDIEELNLIHEYYLPSKELVEDYGFKKFVLDELFAQYDKINELIKVVNKLKNRDK